MQSIAVIGAGSVGAAIGRGLLARGHAVTFGVRDASDPRHAGLGNVAAIEQAARGATVVLLALPADAVTDVVPRLGLRAGQVVIDATNAVRPRCPTGSRRWASWSHPSRPTACTW